MGISALDPPTPEDIQETILEFPDNRLLIDLCGEFDRNLAQIEHKLSVSDPQARQPPLGDRRARRPRQCRHRPRKTLRPPRSRPHHRRRRDRRHHPHGPRRRRPPWARRRPARDVPRRPGGNPHPPQACRAPDRRAEGLCPCAVRKRAGLRHRPRGHGQDLPGRGRGRVDVHRGPCGPHRPVAPGRRGGRAARASCPAT